MASLQVGWLGSVCGTRALFLRFVVPVQKAFLATLTLTTGEELIFQGVSVTVSRDCAPASLFGKRWPQSCGTIATVSRDYAPASYRKSTCLGYISDSSMWPNVLGWEVQNFSGSPEFNPASEEIGTRRRNLGRNLGV